jgi:hypothetical protein
MNLLSVFFVAAGIFSILGGACDWDWFMNARKARFMVTILSRSGARIFYCLLGLGLVVLGVLGTMGIIDMNQR